MVYIADKGYLLSLLTDTSLILIGIFGSVYYTGLIGILALAGWLFLEIRRHRIMRKLRPLVVYPAIKLSWVIALSVLGVAGFVLGELSGLRFFGAVGYLALLAWWFVSFRVYRYQRRRGVLAAGLKKPLKAVKRTVRKKPAQKKRK